MEDVLAGKSVHSDGIRIKRALGLLKDLQRALADGILIVASPIAERENAALLPDPSPVQSIAEPDWKQVIVELLQVMEKTGDHLPLIVLAEKRKIELLMDAKDLHRPASVVRSNTTKRYTKVMKLDQDGNRCWTVVAEGEKKAWETFELESDADNAIAHLSSPVTSLMELGTPPRTLPSNASNVDPECSDLHEDVG